MNAQIFFSCRIDCLLDRLIEQLERAESDPLTVKTIVVPNGQIKQWLLLEIAKKKGIAMGLRMIQVDQLIPSSMHPLHLFCRIYSELLKMEDPGLVSYLDGKKKRHLELTAELSTLFFSYERYGEHLFKESPKNWQQQMFQKLLSPRKLEAPSSIICFGIDTLPPTHWEWLSNSPHLSIYLFSPCSEFWEDTVSDWERKNLNRYWKRRGAAKSHRDQLDTYLRDCPRFLANWGKIGRETLKVFDSFDLEIEDHYPLIEPNSLLRKIQFDLLAFRETKQDTIETDCSIKLFQTGSSLLNEIECLRDEIIRLNLPYHEISVLAPNIEPYVPLIEYLFADQIPYRISNLDIGSKSSFRQGLIRLLHLAGGRWDAEEILTLFETPSFYRKKQWDAKKLEQFRNWVSSVHIKWGRDGEHRREILSQRMGDKQFIDQNSWEKGLDRLLDAMIYLLPLQVNPDLFEEFISAFTELKNLNLGGKKTLASWADALEKAAKQFLVVDLEDEGDSETHESFSQFLIELRNSDEQETFPFEVIHHLLNRPCFGHIHSSHLHAVRFSSIEEGALIPARAIFLIGMDEEHFPRMRFSSSLDLLKGKIPDIADRDRYLFLQALFSAKDFLRISYSHFSSDEGKRINPSILVQELMSRIDFPIITYEAAPKSIKKETLDWPNKVRVCRSERECTIPISDLRQLARHPWKFYLQKTHGIYLNEETEVSFGMQKGRLLRMSLDHPLDQLLTEEELLPGSFGDALRFEIVEKSQEWQKQLNDWQLKPHSLILRESCTAIQWEGETCIAPPLQIGSARVIGEIKQVTRKGLISTTEDHLSGVIKIWPEALITALVLDAPQILMLRSGKQKGLQNIEKSLQSFIDYYFLSLAAPSPLLPDWADPFLRRGEVEFIKKMEKGTVFEDPVIDWVLARAKMPPPQELFTHWAPELKEIFSELIQLYPNRGKKYATV